MEVLDTMNRNRRKITRKKALLNFLLKYLSTNNKLIIYISQDLDNLITKEQKNIYCKYINKIFRKNYMKRVA